MTLHEVVQGLGTDGGLRAEIKLRGNGKRVGRSVVVKMIRVMGSSLVKIRDGRGVVGSF